MSDQIEVAQVNQYSSNVELLVQQRGSKLMSTCIGHTFLGKNSEIIEQIGIIEATEITDRHADTELTDTPHASRWMRPSDWGVADMVDEEDLVRMLIDPRSPYAVAQQYGLGRKFDDIIIDGALGSNQTGQDGGTAVTFANDGGTTLLSGSVGLTVEKLRDAKRTLMANEVDIDNDELWCWISARQHDDLLGQTQVVSGDFNKPMFNTDGKIESFFGINFRHIERLTVNGSDERRCILFAKSGMHCGTWNGLRTRVRERPDKWDNFQVASKWTFGAARSEGEKFVEIPCDES